MIRKKPFERQRLDEEIAKDKRRILTISINSNDETWLNELKRVFDTDKDGEAVKEGAKIGLNVIHSYLRGNFKLVPFIKRERKREKISYFE